MLQTYLLITLFAANSPHNATDTALLAPLITLVLELPHFGQRIAVSIGVPQLGHDGALSLTDFPHSGQFISAMFSTSDILFNKIITYFTKRVDEMLTKIYETYTDFDIYYIRSGDTMNICDFGFNLKNLRKSHNLTQEEFGAKIGLSKAVVSKYENGLGFPTFDVLIQIADYFGVTTDFLLGVEKSKTIDVSSLTDTQVDTIHKIISEFNKANKN